MIIESVKSNLLLRALEQAKFGTVKLTILQPFSERVYGQGAEIAHLTVTSARILTEIVEGGDVELAEAIIREDIKISDEAAFIEWACRNADALNSAFYGRFVGTLLPRLKRWLRPNTVSGAKRNIMQHYDLGNEFYSQWLDPSMTYSSALFTDTNFAEELTAAQMRKYDRIIDELGIKAGDRVLEIGCGWGGFFSRAVERTGCHVTAVLNSPAMAEFDRQLIAKKKIEKHVDLKLTDYRKIEGQFDKVVSIEMIEAVGQSYWPTYFEKVASSLHKNGEAMIQAITIKEEYFAEYSRNPDFISTMIFPGGMLLTNKAVAENAKSVGMRLQNAPFEFGASYAETLKRWRMNFLTAWDQGQFPQFDQKFFHLWRFYLAYCEGAFNAERVNVAHFHLTKRND